MPFEILALVLLSALLHPLWNALLKKGGQPETGYLVLTFVIVLLAGGHALIAGYDLGAILTVWPLYLASTAGQLIYGFFLVMTLRRGDLSAYYPIIRSSPALIVVFGFLVLGERYSLALLGGVALVLTGGFLLQYRPGLRLLSDPRTLACAMLSMSGVAIYSLADSRAVREIPPPVLFFWVEASCLVGYLFIFRLLGEHSVHWTALYQWMRRPLSNGAAGAMAYTSYWLILEAYALGGEVAAVTSVRQASIPISVLIGGVLLREGAVFRRLGASLLLATGIVAIVFS
jgi:drug/metabolite transporter (DMT)-like permease